MAIINQTLNPNIHTKL